MTEVARISELKLKIQSELPFTPNQGQQSAISLLASYIIDSKERSVFILRGYAGTGKTNIISALVRALPSVKRKSVLLAPTGRAAKVMSLYSGKEAFTIHKKIYLKSSDENGRMQFSLAENKHRYTVFIVDEASMISASRSGEGFSDSVLHDLTEYVESGENCKLIFVGDTAQLPPVGTNESPALEPEFLKRNFGLDPVLVELKEVARQQNDSGILYNATGLRVAMLQEKPVAPVLDPGEDVIDLSGADLEDSLNSAIRDYGEDEVLVITRSNKRAVQYNKSYRNRIKNFEEDICTGDRLMIVKNNYFWLEQNGVEEGFIANGDVVEVMSIRRRENLYGFNFIDCRIRFVDDEKLPECEVKLMIDSLYSETPALSEEQQKLLYNTILEDVMDEPSRFKRAAYLRNSPFFNALQVKFAYAITCHKSQGGQWSAVFIDHGFLPPEQMAGIDFTRWLYTAITRATKKVFLVNFNRLLFK